MKIHSICVVKNEADVVAQSLAAAAEWSDHVYVLDNGSTDGTWEEVLAIAERHPPVVAWKRDPRPFTFAMRSEPFEHFRGNAARGDWWCRLDADEIYIDDPRDFLAQVPWYYRSVWSASFQFYFTDRDVAAYDSDPSLYADDVPVAEKCRWYLNNWSEKRFFRHSPGLQWAGGWPQGTYDAVFPRRIRLKHYQYRSPQQIQRRLDDRRNAPSANFSHERTVDWEAAIIQRGAPRRTAGAVRLPESWRERVVHATCLSYDRHDGLYAVDEPALPRIPSLRRSVAGSAKRGARSAARDLRARLAHRPV
jgi:glycosyltransferase involved in cell wall biosynthesis